MLALNSFLLTFKRQPNEDLIWYMIRVQGTLKRQPVAIALMFIVIWVIFQDLLLSIVMLASMYLHEAGHAIVLVLNKIKTRVLVLFPLGAVAAPINKEENKKSDLLPHMSLAFFALGGPFANLALLLLGKGLMYTGINWELGHAFAYINAWLGISNILVIWKLDGALFWKIIFSSSNSKLDTLLSLGVTVIMSAYVGAMLSIAGLTALFSGPALVSNALIGIFVIFLLSGVWHFQGKDDDSLCDFPQAMTLPKMLLMVGVYAMLSYLLFYFGSDVLF